MMPDMNQQRFINQFEQRVKVPIRNNPDMLYKKFWLYGNNNYLCNANYDMRI